MVQPAPSASAEAPDEQELRLALVMTGGVSLAIWIGGAAYEIYRAERARDDRPDREHSYVYQKLLELTQCTIQVDVVSGASAGGINGALYSFAKSRNVAIDDFGQLRDLWRDDASMEKLLRRPTERNPPSLLDGDKYFKPRLVRALKNLNAAGVGSAHDAPTLHIAVTLLNPQSRRFTDDLGSPFAEVDHAGLFKFPASAFDGDAIVEQLALAARSSSSFPGAFEASFVPVGPADATSIDGRPNMAALATFDTSRFTVDGGVLLNEPIAPALEAIAEQPSSKEVRRVLAFVDPSPAAAETDIADDAKSAPTLGTVLWKSLLTIPRVQSVTAQIDTIRNNNRRVLAQGATRRVVASGDPSVVARALWPLYRSRRIDGSVRAIQDVLRRQALLKPHYEDDDPTWRALTASIERWRSEWLPQEFPEHPEQWTSPGWAAAAAQDGANPWPWGIDPLSYAVSAGLDVVRSAFSLAPRGSDDPVASTYRVQLGASREALHDLRRDLRVLTELNDQFWRERAVVASASLR
ncbi:MAG: hypothetical protein QOI08_113, partial [Actinomycetota bacterium]|nr:hypothetical protein [Actinomycetota bacterium]